MRWILGVAMLLALVVPAARAVEGPTTKQLRVIADISLEDETRWPRMIHQHRDIVDDNLVQYLGARSQSAMLQKPRNDRDAWYFALLADCCAREIHRPLIYRLELAQEYWREGEGAQAEDVVQNVMVSDPKMPEPFIMGGNMAFETGDVVNALNQFKKAVALKPNSEEAWLRIAQIDIKLDKPDDARKALQTLLRINPNNQEGKTLQSDLETALKATTVPALPNEMSANKDAVNFYNQAQEATFGGDLSTADSDLHKALQLDPKFIQAEQLLADVLSREGKSDEAGAMYESVVSQEPNNAAAWRAMGWHYEQAFNQHKKQDYIIKAVAAYQQAVQLAPKATSYQDDLDRANAKRAPVPTP
ncbi:MAG: tetratricopeptide repeat protein [Candidatus Xenobia bacterium]